MTRTSLPPTPPAHWLLGHAPEYARDPLGFLQRVARQHGDVVRIKLPLMPTYLVSDPTLVEEVLRGQKRQFIKDRITRRLSRFLGTGLLTSEGDFWRRQRMLAQGGFSTQQIQRYAQDMVVQGRAVFDTWRQRQQVDLQQAMMRLTLAIVARALCRADLSSDAPTIGRTLEVVLEYFLNPAVNWSLLPAWLPVPAQRRFRRAVADLDRIIYRLIDSRQQSGEDPGDLLGRLMAARDEQGQGMTRRQLRDELATLLLAGHETTALTLTFACWLLAMHRQVQRQLQDEVDRVLPDRDPDFADLPQLQLTEQVIRESMRLYPPAWAIAREAVCDCRLGGFDVPRGTQVWVSQWLVHRDPRWYDAPESFCPQRWTAEFRQQLPRGAYFPFGDGPRICIGQQFAMTEAVLLLAQVMRRVELEPIQNVPLTLLPSITLRPLGGMSLWVAPRMPAAGNRPIVGALPAAES